MQVKARRVGNSITVTIPKAVAAELAIDEETELEVVVRGDVVVLEPVLSRWDRLVRDVRRQAQSRDPQEQDVTDAIAGLRASDRR
jgi:antitoxin component of MazEF toxin-antitoxin module